MRTWVAIYTRWLMLPKYQRLSAMGKGALLHVLLLAGFQDPEATWDPDELREALILAGFPEASMDELVGAAWLSHEDGALVYADWDLDQYAAGQVAQRAWEAKRKREWRRKSGRSPSPAPLTPTQQDMTLPDRVPDMSGTNGVGNGVNEVLTLYAGWYRTPPSEKGVDWIANLVRVFGVDRVLTAMTAEHARDGSSANLLSRMEAGLKAGDKAKAEEVFRQILDVTGGTEVMQ